MKLLFDQNLSPRLSQILAEDFPDSKHVLELGLDQTPDLDLWKFARDSGYCIVSKDSRSSSKVGDMRRNRHHDPNEE